MKRLETWFAIAALMLTAALIGACAQSSESAQPKGTAAKSVADSSTKADALQMKDVPDPVQKTIAAETKGGTLVGLSTEKEKHQILYEAEFKVNGRSRNLRIDASGVVAEIEAEVEVSELQPAVRTAIEKTVGNSKIVLVESLTKKDQLKGYEVQLEDSNGKKSEIVFDPLGHRKPAETEEDEDDDDDVK